MRTLSKNIAALTAAGALVVPATAAADATISFTFPAYNPNMVSIAPGEKVTWIGEPGQDFGPMPGPTHHPLRFVAGRQPEQLTGTVTSRTFTEPGSYPFYCVYHWSAGMFGSVEVRTAGAPATPPPPATAPVIPAPEASIVIGDRRSLKGIRTYGMVLRVRVNRAVQSHFALRLGDQVVGEGSKQLTGSGEHGVAVKMSKQGRRTLRKLRRARLQAVLTVRDAVGNARTVTRSFRTTK